MEVVKIFARRLLASAATIIGISLITFILSFAIPADPVRMLAGRSATPETVEAIRHELGLDRPLPIQYLKYLNRLAHADLGRSYKQKTEVAALIWSRLPATLLLMAGAIFFELFIGIPAGVYAATKRGQPADKAAMVMSFIGVSAPQFVVGLLLLYVFANLLGLFPLGGYGSLHHLILPAVTLGITGGGWYSRMLRSSMIDVLQQDYIRTARAKGLRERSVVLVHGMRNAVLPVVAMIGLDIGFFMNGAVVVESVFGWPGIGQLAWQAIQVIDVPVIMGVALVAALSIVIGNFLADVVMPLIDPRLRVR